MKVEVGFFILVASTIVFFVIRGLKNKPSPPQTPIQIAEQVRIEQVREKILALEIQIANEPISILQQQLAELKASIGE